MADTKALHTARPNTLEPPHCTRSTRSISRKHRADAATRCLALERALRTSERHYTKSLEQSRRLQEQLRGLSHQILAVQEKERKRVSRELHDEIVQMLTAINLRLAKLGRAKDLNSLGRQITATQRLVEKSIEVVHGFARALRPTLLDDLGLVPAIHSFLKDLAKPAGLRIDFTACADLHELLNDQRTVLFRVAQEALTNVARHAHAKHVRIIIQRIPGGLRMEISDDGSGFPLDRVWSAHPDQRLGLLGMRERVQMVGGRFCMDSAPRRGTTVRADIPTGHRSLPPLPSEDSSLLGRDAVRA